MRAITGRNCEEIRVANLPKVGNPAAVGGDANSSRSVH